MPENLFVYRDKKKNELCVTSNKDWNSPRYNLETAQKIANQFEGAVVQFRPADPYFGKEFGQVGQRDDGYIVKIGYGYLYSINKEPSQKILNEAIEYGKLENLPYVPDVTQYSKVQLDQLL
jgi:hypothetical protein